MSLNLNYLYRSDFIQSKNVKMKDLTPSPDPFSAKPSKMRFGAWSITWEKTIFPEYIVMPNQIKNNDKNLKKFQVDTDEKCRVSQHPQAFTKLALSINRTAVTYVHNFT